MSQGLDNLEHIVVLMMENRSFDHMLGAMKQTDSRINGLNGDESNPDSTGVKVLVQSKATFQGQFGHDPDHHFAGVDLQIFGGNVAPDRVANMQGFIKSYATQGTNTDESHAIMYYFTPQQLPVLTTLATEPEAISLLKFCPRARSSVEKYLGCFGLARPGKTHLFLK